MIKGMFKFLLLMLVFGLIDINPNNNINRISLKMPLITLKTQRIFCELFN